MVSHVTAFHGLIQAKHDIICKASELASSGSIKLIKPPALDSASGTGTAFALLVNDVSYATAERELGIPTSVALVNDILLAGMGRDVWVDDQFIDMSPVDSVQAFLDWLEAVPVGISLDTLQARFIAAFLRGVLAGGDGLPLAENIPATLRTVMGEVATLHDLTETLATDWSSLRKRAIQVTRELEHTQFEPLAVFVESIVWPTRTVPEELPNAFQRLQGAIRRQEGRKSYTQEELDLQTNYLEAVIRFQKVNSTLSAHEVVAQLPEAKMLGDFLKSERGQQVKRDSLEIGSQVGASIATYAYSIWISTTRSIAV
ncbi:hypothetical protein IAE37_002230 [Pseudomonas sp. S31]|uniref:hypothetical protein n=1 Tax=Pseudomonas sp. S31 TaxID=1564473 RepID=UPI00191305D6|nr:hypothetical protein [Pseudomonas sp. S31]MBK4999954.1 hypothetical protein [Pseudomonas sp. S31]